MTNLENIMATKGMPTLKAIATVLGIQPTRIYSVAKTPKEGEIYDAKVYNWEAIERFVERRLGQNEVPETVEEVIDKALEVDIELKANDGRKNRTGSAAGRKIEVDGKMIPERRYSNHEWKDEDGNVLDNLVAFKKDPEVYKIIFQTRSHTVLMPVDDAAGTITKSHVKVVSNFMMNHSGFNPVQNATQVEIRLNGEYVNPDTVSEDEE